MKHRLMCILFVALVATPGRAAGLDIASGPLLHRLPLHAAAVDHMNFMMYIPTGVNAPHDGFPLILFLHGSEQRGDDPSLLVNLPILSFAQKVDGFPFVTIVPQCPRGLLWSPDMLRQLLAAVEELTPVDKDRLYLTGFSMGGYGTWQTAAALPGVFAAIAPLCALSDLPDTPPGGRADLGVSRRTGCQRSRVRIPADGRSSPRGRQSSAAHRVSGPRS